MFQQRYDEQLDEINVIAASLNRKATVINSEVNEQNRYMDKMKLELEQTKKNMDSIAGNFDNLVKAMGRLRSPRQRHVVEHTETYGHVCGAANVPHLP